MYNIEYERISQKLNSKEKSIFVKSLDNPIKSIPSIIDKLTTLGLIEVYEPGLYTTTDLGYEIATYIQSQFSIQDNDIAYDEARERWRVGFEIVMPRPYGSFMAVEQFRDQVFVSEALESRAVSAAHSVIRSRYPTASRIRVVSREVYQLPIDLDQPVEFIPSSGSSE